MPMGRSAQLRGRMDPIPFNGRCERCTTIRVRPRRSWSCHRRSAWTRKRTSGAVRRRTRLPTRTRSRPSPRASATQHELARIELLAGLPGEILGRLARNMEREEVAPGTVLMREGEPGDRFYVVLAGVLAVSQRDLGA